MALVLTTDSGVPESIIELTTPQLTALRLAAKTLGPALFPDQPPDTLVANVQSVPAPPTTPPFTSLVAALTSLSWDATAKRFDYIGSTSSISISPSGAAGVVDISTVRCGGTVVATPSAHSSIDGFTAMPNGFWFDLFFDSNSSTFNLTINENVAGALTSVRNPDSIPTVMGRGWCVRFKYFLNRWRAQLNPEGSVSDVSIAPSGAAGVIDIANLRCGGTVVCVPAADATIDGFTAKPTGFWFDLFFDSASSAFLVTFAEDVGATTTSIRNPQGVPTVIGRGACLRFKWFLNRWRVQLLREYPNRPNADTDGSTATTSAAFQQAQTLGTFSVEAGTYLYSWYAELNLSALIGGVAQVRAVLDGTPVSLQVETFGVSSNDFIGVTGWAIRTLTAGNHTGVLEYASDGAATTSIRRRRLNIVRVA